MNKFTRVLKAIIIYLSVFIIVLATKYWMSSLESNSLKILTIIPALILFYLWIMYLRKKSATVLEEPRRSVAESVMFATVAFMAYLFLPINIVFMYGAVVISYYILVYLFISRQKSKNNKK